MVSDRLVLDRHCYGFGDCPLISLFTPPPRYSHQTRHTQTPDSKHRQDTQTLNVSQTLIFDTTQKHPKHKTQTQTGHRERDNDTVDYLHLIWSSTGSERTDSRSGSECSGEPEGGGTNGNIGWRTFDSSLGTERTFDSSLGVAGAALATPPPAIEIAATGGAWARAPVSFTCTSIRSVRHKIWFLSNQLVNILCRWLQEQDSAPSLASGCLNHSGRSTLGRWVRPCYHFGNCASTEVWKPFFKELLLQGKNISQKNTLFIIYHTVPVSNCYCCCYWSHWAAVSRHLATFCGKFWAAVIFWTFSAIFGIFSEVLPMGTVDTLYLWNSNNMDSLKVDGN